MSNVIIMTAGLAGSSVLTGLVARAGFWTGHETFKKTDYNTYENHRLIELNQLLFKEVGFDGNYTEIFPGWVIDALEYKADQIDPGPFVEFIRECERNGPWIWKDPRLNLTMQTWARWLDLQQIRFLMISRELGQSWISSTLRRQIQTYEYHAVYNDRVRRAIEAFFNRFGLSHLPVIYEDLIVQPEQTIAELNHYLGTSLSIEDLQQIYFRDLYKRQHGLRNMTRAMMIYLKNYRARRFLDYVPQPAD